MAKVAVIYHSKYGNTRRVAEEIASGIEEVSGVETIVVDVKEVDLNRISDSDAILIGSPNHMGKQTRRIRKFIDGLGEANLKGKSVAVFDTYIGKDFEKTVKRMEKQINEEVSDLELISPGLSIKVGGMKGPIVEEDLPKCREFGNKVASQLSNTGATDDM